MADPKEIFKSILQESASKLAPGVAIEIQIERPKNPEHGDLSSNIALQIAKQLKGKPRDIAQQFVAATADAIRTNGFKALEIAGPGFLNARVEPSFKLQVVKEVLAK